MKEMIRLFKVVSGIAIMLAAQTGAFAQSSIIADNFSGTNLNTNLWITATPFCDSQMFETNGVAVFVNRGRLLTRALLPNQYKIQGSFQLTGSSYDQFSIWLRTDGYASNQYASFQDGVVVDFQVRSGDQGQTGINNINIVDSVGNSISTNFNLALNTYYPFTVVDTSTSIILYMTNSITPFLTLNTTNRAGFQLGLQNREGTCGGSSISAGSITQLDFINATYTDLSIYTAVELDFVAIGGQTYQIQSSTNLTTWNNIGSPIIGSNQLIQQFYSTQGTNAKFYRANATP